VRFRIARPLAAASLPALLVACWDAPVRPRLELAFAADGTARAELVVALDSTSLWSGEEEAAVRARLEREAAGLEVGDDPRLLPFDLVGCSRQGGAWEKLDGDLVEYRRWTECAEAAAVLELLAGAPLAADLTSADGIAELSILRLGGGPAARAERDRVLAEIAAWSEALERYYAAVWRLAAAARRRPAAAPDLWRAAFEGAAGDPERPLDGTGEALAGELSDAIDEVARVLRPERGEERSADERAREVFDPLPARLTVVLPADAIEVEGFVAAGAGRWAAPEAGLYGAVTALEGRWLAREPLVARVEHGRAGGELPLDVAAFVSDPRRVERPPAADEIAAALLERLEDRTPLRLTWPAPEPADEGAAAAAGEEEP
jgi:hypothetical protein